MKLLDKAAILHQAISKSPLSIEFKTVTEVLGFHNFSELLEHRTITLEKLPGFTQQLIYEYVEYFEINGIGHLIDP